MVGCVFVFVCLKDFETMRGNVIDVVATNGLVLTVFVFVFVHAVEAASQLQSILLNDSTIQSLVVSPWTERISKILT